MDIQGKEMLSTFSLRKNATQTIDISKIKEGAYLIMVETEGRLLDKKWMKVE